MTLLCRKEKKSSITACPFDLKEKRKQAAVETAGPTLAANYFCELQRGFFYFYVSDMLLCCVFCLCCWIQNGGADPERDANEDKQVYFKEVFR